MTDETQLRLSGTLKLILALIAVFCCLVAQSNQCYFDLPEDRDNCVFSCTDNITEEYFQSLPDIMTSCKTVSYYLSEGNFTTFSPGYFANLGHVKHFFFELQDVIFDDFPGAAGEGSPFANMTFDTSAILYVIRVKVTNSWNWALLADLEPVRGGSGSIEVWWSDITHLSRDFRQVMRGSLWSVRFSDSNLRTLDDDVFSSFDQLQEVYLHGNEIALLKRNYFPNPANMLQTLVLQSNKLQSLPIDMFLNMPRLREVALGGNDFTTIDEVVFRPIFGKVPLKFKSGELHCDCRLRWLKYVTGPELGTVQSDNVCLTPLALEGRSLENLTEEELGCDENEFD